MTPLVCTLARAAYCHAILYSHHFSDSFVFIGVCRGGGACCESPVVSPPPPSAVCCNETTTHLQEELFSTYTLKTALLGRRGVCCFTVIHLLYDLVRTLLPYIPPAHKKHVLYSTSSGTCCHETAVCFTVVLCVRLSVWFLSRPGHSFSTRFRFHAELSAGSEQRKTVYSLVSTTSD